jgi:hypothetical protein
MASVSAVVLNWNNAPETVACLRSLTRTRNCALSLLVIDNGSTDDSVASIKVGWPDAKLIETGSNLGYAEGNNTGIRAALSGGADFVFVINNDARVAADTLDRLARAAEAVPDAAFLGPTIYHLERPEEVQSRGMDLDLLWRSRPRTEPPGRRSGEFEDVPCLSGAAMLLRASALDRIGLLDASLFMYREDVDWCMRARRLGYRILCVPEARAWHRSDHARQDELPRITYYMTRNSLSLLSKHAGGPVRLTALLARFALTALSWTVRPRWREKGAERDALVLGVVDFLRGKTGCGYA